LRVIKMCNIYTYFLKIRLYALVNFMLSDENLIITFFYKFFNI